MTYPPPPPGPWQPTDEPNPSSGAPQPPTTPIPGAAYPMPPTQPFAAPDPQPYPHPHGAQQPYPPYGPPQPYPASGPAPKGNKTLIAVIVAAGVLLVAGVATSVVLFLRNASDDRPLSQPSTAVTSAAAPASPDPTAEATPEASPEASPGEPSATSAPAEGITRKVVYEVTGKGKSTITYATTISGEVKQLQDQKLPWTLEFDAGDDAALLVSGLADFSTKSDVSCRILVDGKEVAKEKGAFAMCTDVDY